MLAFQSRWKQRLFSWTLHLKRELLALVFAWFALQIPRKLLDNKGRQLFFGERCCLIQPHLRGFDDVAPRSDICAHGLRELFGSESWQVCGHVVLLS